MEIQNLNQTLKKIKEENYAILHININNLEWAKFVLLATKEANLDIILGASPSAIKYMGGYKTVVNLVNGLIQDLEIKTNVILHLDHGNYNDCINAINAGFKSIMYDGSKEDFETNILNAKKIVNIAKKLDITVEAEVGRIGLDISKNKSLDIQKTNIEDAKKLANTGIDLLAVAIGNIHGQYESNWKGLDFELLDKLNQEIKIPLVLHGASGIKEDDIKKAIKLGIKKINFNTELQIANAKALNDFLKNNNFLENKNYNPRILYANSNQAIYKCTLDLLNKYGKKN